VLDSVAGAREGLERRAYEQELAVGGFGVFFARFWLVWLRSALL
jgi:hypothetical protein